MNASPNHSVLELDQFNLAEHSLMSFVGLFFRSKGPETETNPYIDLDMDRSFETANTVSEKGFSGSNLISEDFEYDVAGWTINSPALDMEPLAGIMDESFLQNIDDIPIDATLPLVDYSYKDTPKIFKSFDLNSHSKNKNVGSNIVSAIVHLAVIFALALSNPTGSTGQYGNSPEPIFVRLIDPNSSVVQQCSIASVDSAASCPSIAQRSKGERDKSEQQTEEPLPKSALEVDDGNRHGGGEGNVDTVTTAKSDARFVEQALSLSKTIEKNDDVNFESLSMIDSVASQASTASKENRSAAPQGEAADQFKRMVLTAIHEVAFYPKDALHRREFGETLVSFTVLRDGSIENLSVVRQSGSNALDKAALKIVEKASTRFPQIPETLGHSKLNYVIPIAFRRKS